MQTIMNLATHKAKLIIAIPVIALASILSMILLYNIGVNVGSTINHIINNSLC